MSEYGGNETVTCPSWALLVESEEEPAASLRGHVARCPRCRERYRIVTALRLMGTREGRTPPESGCPELAEWLELATGDPEARTRALLVEHLSGCDPCSRRWSYISDSLASTDPDWELKEPDPTIPYVEAPGRTLRWGPFLGRAAAVILAVGLVWAMASGLLPRIGTGSATRWRGPDPALAASVQWGAAEPAVTFT